MSKYEAKGHNLGWAWMGMPGHARGRFIQQDDAAFYRITSISCFLEQSYVVFLLKVQGGPKTGTHTFVSNFAKC